MHVTRKVIYLLHHAGICCLVSLSFVVGCTYDSAPLHTAIRKGNTKSALKYIAKGKYINTRDSVMHQETIGKTPLYCATARGQHDVVAALLEAGADVHMEEEREGKLPIHAAAMNGRARIAGLLIEHGARVEARDDDGRLPLMFAATSGDAQTVKLLLDHGARANAANRDGLLPIIAASRYGHLEAVQSLIRAGADVNARGDAGWTPVILAAAGPHIEVAECLVRNGADINAATEAGWTPLMMAAGKGDMACVKLFIERGANRNAPSTDCHWTALHFAAYNDHTAVADYLIDCEVQADPISDSERDCYATAVSQKLLARHHEEKGDRQAAIRCYAVAGEYYEKASVAFKERSSEIGGKISSAKLAALGRFAGTLAVSAIVSSAMPSINTGSSSHHMIITPTSGPTADTTDLSSLKKDCDRRIKESKRCATACRQIVECYQNGNSGPKAQRQMRDAREKLGLL